MAEAIGGFPDPPRRGDSRWRVADGKPLWTFTVPALQIDMRGDGISFAWASTGTTG